MVDVFIYGNMLKITSETGKRTVVLNMLEPFKLEENGSSHIRINSTDMYTGDYRSTESLIEINKKIEEHYSSNMSLK